MICPICSAQMVMGREEWHFECPSCRFECSNLQAKINEQAAHANIDESSRFNALTQLRVENFKDILSRLGKYKLPPAEILDVGCSHGWFLQVADKYGYAPIGIEAESAIAEDASRKGMNVRKGFFPTILDDGERYPVIILNDVFEHLSDITEAARSIHWHLEEGGIAVINGPNRGGFFYRTSKILHSLGWKMPFERMWQIGFASPHASYFTPADLHILFTAVGFAEVERFSVSSLRVRGLWSRLSYDARQNSLLRVFVWVGTLMSVPFIRLFPSDNMVQFFVKK